MKKNLFLKTVGLATILLMFGININRALNGYDVGKISLHSEVIAQTNSTGNVGFASNDGGGSGNGNGGNGNGADPGGGTDSHGRLICTAEAKCFKEIYRNGQWDHIEYGKIDCRGYESGRVCTVGYNYVICDLVRHDCN